MNIHIVFIFIWAFTHMNICISIPWSVLISPTWNTRQEEKTLLLWGSWPGHRPAVFLWGSLSTWPEAELTFGLEVWRAESWRKPPTSTSRCHSWSRPLPLGTRSETTSPSSQCSLTHAPQGLIRWGVAGVCRRRDRTGVSATGGDGLLPPGGMDLPAAFSQWPQTHLERQNQAQCPLVFPMPFCSSSEALPKLWPLPGQPIMSHHPWTSWQNPSSPWSLRWRASPVRSSLSFSLDWGAGAILSSCVPKLALWAWRWGVWLLTLCPP